MVKCVYIYAVEGINDLFSLPSPEKGYVFDQLRPKVGIGAGPLEHSDSYSFCRLP